MKKESGAVGISWSWFKKREAKPRKGGIVTYSPNTAVWRVRLWLCFWLCTQGTLNHTLPLLLLLYQLYQCKLCLVGQEINYVNIVAYLVGMCKYFTKILVSIMMPPRKQAQSDWRMLWECGYLYSSVLTNLAWNDNSITSLKYLVLHEVLTASLSWTTKLTGSIF